MDDTNMDVREAAQAAKEYLINLFDGEEIAHVGLEEVEFDDASNNWKITIGFSRPWDHRNPLTAALGEGRPARSYKVVRINDDDGRVISVKDRVLAASE